VAGRRAYEIARRAGLVDLQPAAVLVHQLDWIGRADDLLRLRVTASSGFYVRALARDLGSRLGCGAHLAGLRRTEIGPFAVGQAMPFEEALRLGREVDARLIAPADALPHLAAVTATDAGLRRVLHGNPVGPEHLAGQVEMARGTEAVRVLGPDGRLVALARPRGGALHPVAVLG
jgi:tRNA U55 pseudouridine synthase TruB